MDKILQGVAKCICNQDDILVGGVDTRKNLQIVGEVLERLQKVQPAPESEKVCFPEDISGVPWLAGGH